MKNNTLTIALAASFSVTACASQKSTVQPTAKATTVQKTTDDGDKAKIDYLDKVNSNASFQKNIIEGITFTVSRDGGKEISVPGQLRMRKNTVIRLSLQMPIIGTEVGRIEFTPDYVLFVDRMHKEYVKAPYNKVSFLKDNGINFYTLQTLFWNQLYLPGKTAVGYTDLDSFKADVAGYKAQVPVTLTDGKLSFTWTTQRSDATIRRTRVDYKSPGHGISTLVWDYSGFRTLGSKPFPYSNTMTVTTPATGKTRTIKASFVADNITTSSDWEANTTLSDKYKEVAVEDILGKLMGH